MRPDDCAADVGAPFVSGSSPRHPRRHRSLSNGCAIGFCPRIQRVADATDRRTAAWSVILAGGGSEAVIRSRRDQRGSPTEPSKKGLDQRTTTGAMSILMACSFVGSHCRIWPRIDGAIQVQRNGHGADSPCASALKRATRFFARRHQPYGRELNATSARDAFAGPRPAIESAACARGA
jgi:hypothetical protein